jgi:hypothetical protein
MSISVVASQEEAFSASTRLLPASSVGEIDTRLLYERIMQGVPGGELRWFNDHEQVLFATEGHIFWLPLKCARTERVQYLLRHRNRWQDPWERFSGILRKIERDSLRWYPYNYGEAAFMSRQRVLLRRSVPARLVEVQSCLLRKDSSYPETMYFVRAVEQAGSEQFVFEHELAYPPD